MISSRLSRREKCSQSLRLRPCPARLQRTYLLLKCRLRDENEFLRHQNNSLVVLLNDAQERKKASFNASQKRFFELTKAARNNKKRRIKNLVVQSLKGLQEFVPIEVCSFLPYFIFFVATPLELPIDFISIINTVTSANNYQATVSSRLHSPRWRSATLQKFVFA